MIRLSGRLRSALIIGGQGIRARKTRTFLSIISLFLGVLAVVVVQAAAETVKQAELANIELQEGRDGTVRMYVSAERDAVPITLETLRGRTDAVGALGMQAIIGEPGVLPVNPGGASFDNSEGGLAGPPGEVLICDRRGFCESRPAGGEDGAPPGQAIELSLVALTGDVRPFRPYRLESGQWLDFASPPSLAPRIVVNAEAAKGFARHRIPAEIRISGAVANATPRIVGVVDDGNGMPTAYVRADELTNWVPPEAEVFGGVEVYRHPTAGAVEQILRSRLAANGVPGDHLHSEVIRAKEEIAEQLAIFRFVFLGIAGLVLLIGVAGILNVGLATVGERVEEFALRRAVGTPRSLLAGIVLAETLITGLFTAAAAIGVAAACLRLAGDFLGSREPALQDLVFPWQAAVAGIIAGLIAGVLGGLIPAVRAARIPIATVMRA